MKNGNDQNDYLSQDKKEKQRNEPDVVLPGKSVAGVGEQESHGTESNTNRHELHEFTQISLYCHGSSTEHFNS